MKAILKTTLETLIVISLISLIYFGIQLFYGSDLLLNSQLLLDTTALLITSMTLRSSLFKAQWRFIVAAVLSAIYIVVGFILSIDIISLFMLISALMIFFTFDNLISGKLATWSHLLNGFSVVLFLILYLTSIESVIFTLLTAIVLVINTTTLIVSRNIGKTN